jgi:hypothetical protein
MGLIVRRVGGVLGTIRAEYRQLHNRYFGSIERFEGNAQQICNQIIDRLWEGDFYRTSLGHFDFFWMRDFGTVCQSLVNLGYTNRVHHTLAWALQHYRRAGDVTLCIDKAGNTFNAPAKKSIDALPWLLHSLVAGNYQLTLAERAFLDNQLEKYCTTFLDPTTGNIRDRVRYAELRDAVYYNQSAYSLALIARMAKCADELGLQTFPFDMRHYQNDLVNNYWTGEYFQADRTTKSYSSECALMPFFLDVIDDAEKAAQTFDYIQRAGLNALYPLQYCTEPDLFHYRPTMGKAIMPNYTGTTIWTWHGTFYLHLLKRYQHSDYHQQYANFTDLIEHHGTYPELINNDGTWYKAPFYMADPGMVWAALFLELPEGELSPAVSN